MGHLFKHPRNWESNKARSAHSLTPYEAGRQDGRTDRRKGFDGYAKDLLHRIYETHRTFATKDPHWPGEPYDRGYITGYRLDVGRLSEAPRPGYPIPKPTRLHRP